MTLGRERSPIRAANDLSIILRTVLKDDRFPVDVEALCLEYTKIYSDPITKVVGDSLGSFEGMLRPGRKKPCWHIIYNNDTNYRGRERFTLAHELGHYLLHRQPLIEGDTPTDLEARTFSCNPMERYRWQQAEEKDGRRRPISLPPTSSCRSTTTGSRSPDRISASTCYGISPSDMGYRLPRLSGNGSLSQISGPP